MKNKTPVSAIHKLMDYVALRNHTELELREKLSSVYGSEEIEKAIQHAKTKGWIPDSEQAIAEQASEVAEGLRRRGKGSQYINQYLEKKGLPQITSDDGEELEKAKQLVENKFYPLESLNPAEQEKQKAKIGRFLMSRGFDEETVRKVIYED